jgi:hypothetical protein
MRINAPLPFSLRLQLAVLIQCGAGFDRQLTTMQLGLLFSKETTMKILYPHSLLQASVVSLLDYFLTIYELLKLRSSE